MGMVVAGLGQQEGLAVGDVRPEVVESVRRTNPSLANRRQDLYRDWAASEALTIA
jgi:hypothetical protein